MGVVVLQLLQDDVGALDDAPGHSRNLGHMDTKAVLRAALLELAQEDDFAVDLLHRDVVVLNAGKIFLHLVQLVVVGGEERARPAGLRVLVQVFNDGPGYRDAVVGRRAAAQLVEEHQRAAADVVQDVRGLSHLDHERRFAQGDIVRGAHTGEDFVHQADFRGLCGHEAAHLGQQHNEGRLAQQRRLTGHVGAGDDDNLLSLVV